MKSAYLAACAALAVVAVPASAATTLYGNRVAFTGALSTSVTDDYENAGYQFIQNDAAMSAVLGETDYTSTGFSNLNIVFQSAGTKAYCAGCNGSFRLSFGTTSQTVGNGVFGVGFDMPHHDIQQLPYSALVTFGDATTALYALGGAGSFFGITSDRQIASIDFGPGGQTTISGSISIDNLTIGSVGGAVPEPATWAMMILGFGLVGASMRVRARKVALAF